MRILFAGTPEIGVPSLDILSKNFDICGVLTNPDRPKGRKKVLIPCPVKEKALELNLEVLQPEKLTTDFYTEVRALKPDLLVCIAFGKIFKKEFLDIFSLGALNIHPSLLPIYRGSSPLNAAILNGDSESGISIQRMAQKMDAGNILLQEKFSIGAYETTGELIDRVAIMAAPLINKVVTDIDNNSVQEYEQDSDKATFCKLIKKEDGVINWNLKSSHILNAIRGYNPWPYAQTMFLDKTLNILTATNSELSADVQPGMVISYSKQDGFLVKTADGAIYVTTLQLQSKKALDYKSFNNGVQNFVGTLLG
ncbi:MAG: methionyl-tRNA formyltransferase [Spirochaetaceae bacterium]